MGPAREGTLDATLWHDNLRDDSRATTGIRTGVIRIIYHKLALDSVNPLTTPARKPHESLSTSTTTASHTRAIALVIRFDIHTGFLKALGAISWREPYEGGVRATAEANS